MGVFDRIKAECPCCGVPFEFQSKSGPCDMTDYDFRDVPFNVLSGAVGDRHLCECGKMITLAVIERRMFIPTLEAR